MKNLLKQRTKILFMSLLAGITVSCTKTETIEGPRGKAIAFRDSYTAKAGLNTGTFSVIGFTAATGNPDYTAAASIPATSFKLGETGGQGWYKGPGDYSDIKYFDGESSYWFFTWGNYAGTVGAGTPELSDITTGNSGVVYQTNASNNPSITINTGNAGSNGLVDLVTAGAQNITIEQQGKPIALAFKHALTKVRFTAKSGEVNPNEVKITGLKYVVNHSECSVDLTVQAQTSVTNTGSAAATYSITPATPLTLGSIPSKINNASEANTLLYVVPQALSTDIAFIEVTYTLGSNPSEFTRKIPVDNKLGQNKSVNYELTIERNKITFVASVEDWDAEVVEIFGEGTPLFLTATSNTTDVASSIAGNVANLISTTPNANYTLRLGGTIAAGTNLTLAPNISSITTGRTITLDFAGMTGFQAGNGVTITPPSGYTIEVGTDIINTTNKKTVLTKN